jgi:hypothetical protein
LSQLSLALTGKLIHLEGEKVDIPVLKDTTLKKGKGVKVDLTAPEPTTLKKGKDDSIDLTTSKDTTLKKGKGVKVDLTTSKATTSKKVDVKVDAGKGYLNYILAPVLVLIMIAMGFGLNACMSPSKLTAHSPSTKTPGKKPQSKKKATRAMNPRKASKKGSKRSTKRSKKG